MKGLPMKSGTIFAASLALTLTLASGPALAAESSVVVEPNNAFAAGLYAKLAGTEGNLFFSPNSIETALVMTAAGARGNTLDQMAAVLGFPRRADLDWTGIHKAFGVFLKDLNAEKGADGKPRPFQLSVANALWGQKGYAFLPDYLKLVKDNYGAGLSELDFQADTEGSRKTINTWVEKETRDKIKDLLKPGILTADTRLVLTNAIYFKGNWAEQFKADQTKDEPFHLGGGKDTNTTTPLGSLCNSVATTAGCPVHAAAACGLSHGCAGTSRCAAESR